MTASARLILSSSRLTEDIDQVQADDQLRPLDDGSAMTSRTLELLGETPVPHAAQERPLRIPQMQGRGQLLKRNSEINVTASTFDSS